MPTISAKISEKEYEAISYYANACGESISSIIKKTLIQMSTYSMAFGGFREYDYGVYYPEACTGEEEDKIVKDTINHCRRILGMDEVDDL